MPSLPFAKGHGAHNDFIVLPDPAARLSLSPADVSRLCHRRTGIGADGLLRAVRCAALPEAAPLTRQAEWYMDYYNADGSQGTMCGNGIRVLARYLTLQGLCPPGPTPIATRAGVHTVHVPRDDAPLTVDMGRPHLPGTPDVTVNIPSLQRSWPAIHVDMGNPHAVTFVTAPTEAGPLNTPPRVTPTTAYPTGVTVGFAQLLSPSHLFLRVHERGVGETKACGTGACAAVAALRHVNGWTGKGSYVVDVPGGRLGVRVEGDGRMMLEGPAVIVARGEISLAS